MSIRGERVLAQLLGHDDIGNDGDPLPLPLPRGSIEPSFVMPPFIVCQSISFGDDRGPKCNIK
jgi:hypothetical protein